MYGLTLDVPTQEYSRNIAKLYVCESVCVSKIYNAPNKYVQIGSGRWPTVNPSYYTKDGTFKETIMQRRS